MKWDWLPCGYNLQKFESSKEIIWNLTPFIVFFNDHGQEPEVAVTIDFEKSLIYSPELGWNWHKSWNLPVITVSVEAKDKGETLLPPPNVVVQIFAVKTNFSSKDNFNLLEVGLKGENKSEVLNGQVSFNGLKFSSTSYNNEGSKFHLVVCVYVQVENETAPRILDTRISPPIFVDSRKSARDSSRAKIKAKNKLYELFPPDVLDRKFIKRDTKKKKKEFIEIENTIDGFIHYLSAPNIRNKIRHPLFLSMKFPSCIKFYHKKNSLCFTSDEEYLDSLQKKLSKAYSKNEKKGNMPCFILHVMIKNDKKTPKLIKKINDFLDSAVNDMVTVVYDDKLIKGGQYEEYQNLESLLETYKKKFFYIFPKQLKKKNYKEEEQSDENSDELFKGHDCNMKATFIISSKSIESEFTNSKQKFFDFISADNDNNENDNQEQATSIQRNSQNLTFSDDSNLLKHSLDLKESAPKTKNKKNKKRDPFIDCDDNPTDFEIIIPNEANETHEKIENIEISSLNQEKYMDLEENKVNHPQVIHPRLIPVSEMYSLASGHSFQTNNPIQMATPTISKGIQPNPNHRSNIASTQNFTEKNNEEFSAELLRQQHQYFIPYQGPGIMYPGQVLCSAGALPFMSSQLDRNIFLAPNMNVVPMILNQATPQAYGLNSMFTHAPRIILQNSAPTNESDNNTDKTTLKK